MMDFLDLPQDVMMIIVLFLNPIEYIYFLMTCKTIYEFCGYFDAKYQYALNALPNIISRLKSVQIDQFGLEKINFNTSINKLKKKFSRSRARSGFME